MIKPINIKELMIGIGKPKICVSITGKTQEEIIEQIKSLKNSTAQLVEWRVDFYEHFSDNKATIKFLNYIANEFENIPIIFTFRTIKEGGQSELSLQAYQDLLEEVIESKLIDIVDIELFIGDEIVLKLIEVAHNNGVKIILSNHDFEKTPSQTELVSRLIKMQNLNADILKIAVMPNKKSDVLTLLSATEEMVTNYANRPVVTMSMAKEGLYSRIIGEMIGSSITFACIGEASAPGQINIEEMAKLLSVLHRNYKKNNIFLIGFMGTGKSSVSNELSAITGMCEKDMDSLIEEQENIPISEIFEQFGEEYFRSKESQLLNNLVQYDHQIISCGGGVVLKEQNIRCMKTNGYVICLSASPQTIFERVKYCEKRPILNGNMNVQYIEQLMQKRMDYYLNAADIIIQTDGKSISQIGKEIVTELDKRDR